MEMLTQEHTQKLLLDMPLSVSGCRRPKSKEDFGDQETVGLHLKRREFPECEDNQGPFGRYLGEHDGTYVVAVTGVFDFLYGIAYDSLEELHKEWVLD